MRRTALLLCIGNELRGDDGAGPAAGRMIEALGLEGVRVETAFQLFPEHAELAGQFDVCVLVDASLATDTVLLRRAEIPEHARGDLHGTTFASLLALCDALYGRRPEAWVCEIPAAELAHGAGLSAGCRAAVETAVRQLGELLEQWLSSQT